MLILGAHVHLGEIRAPLSSLNPELLNLTLMMTPGLSPIFGNNPGYTILDIDEDEIKATWRFF